MTIKLYSEVQMLQKLFKTKTQRLTTEKQDI